MAISRIFKALTASEIESVIANLYGSDTKLVEYSLMKGGLSFFRFVPFRNRLPFWVPINSSLVKPSLGSEPRRW